MTTVATLQRETPDQFRIPPLQNGDRLTREEFERRWDLHPEIKNAELIDGRVYVEVTVYLRHGVPHSVVMAWLGAYWAKHPELQVADNTTVRLEGDNDPQPDALLRRIEGGSSQGSTGRLEGPPELVVEIAATSAAYDLHEKKDLYRRSGVAEYVVWQLFEERLDWFRLEGDEYVALAQDEHGIIESRAFPGLRLDVPKLIAGDVQGVLAAIS